MVCKGVECVRHKANKPVGIGRYASGQKYCKECRLYLWYAGLRCPCCNTMLRGKPRECKYKQLYNETKQDNVYGVKLKDGN